MPNWKNSPYAQLGAALLFVATALLMLYLNGMMIYSPDSTLTQNMQQDRTYYAIGICVFTLVPFYFLFRAWRIIRIKNYDDAEYAELWQKPGNLTKLIFLGVMLLALVAAYFMVQVKLSIYR